jgi:acid phosphatase (class A)
MKARMMLAALLLSAPFVLAKEPGGQGPQLKYLNPADVAAAAILPPPFSDGSVEQIEELAELRSIAKTRTEERLELARFDDLTISAKIFHAVIPGFDPEKLPVTAKLLETAKREAGLVSHLAKEHFDRKRPYEFDPSLNVCSKHRGKNATYPSGHTTAGYAMAVTLAHIMPNQADTAMIRAATYGKSRMICGVHYRSDVVAGQVVGTAVALALLQKPEFQAEMAAARAELKAAGLAQ